MGLRRRDEAGNRGLPSLQEARAERRRAIVLGKVRVRAMPPQFWLWSALVIAALMVVYWKFAQGKIESAKGAVMSKQRAIAQSLGPQILPFRDKVEGWAKELAGEWKGERFSSTLAPEEIRHAPSVYLRLRLENAKTADKMRKAAVESLHDGFTSCFFVRKGAPDPSAGPKCQTSAECQPGLLCNEYDVCTRPPEPFNMRLAYRSLRVLSTAWTDELHESNSELAITAYDRDLDKVTREDVPIAAQILKRAKYFVLVLDEDPPAGLPPQPDGGVETEEERLQRVPHAARVGIWKLDTGELVARMREQAAGRALPVGDQVVTRAETIAAQERQANSCALALAVKSELVAHTPPPKKDADAGAADAAADAAAQESSDAAPASVDAAPAPVAAPDSGAAP
jgi:hypothetical protein